MTPNEYQQQAFRTLISDPGEFRPDQLIVIRNAIGLAGEAGEVAELVKKGIFHRHGLDLDKLKKELGDCLWYIAALGSVTGLDLETIMEANIEKLKERYPLGFTVEASASRVI